MHRRQSGGKLDLFAKGVSKLRSIKPVSVPRPGSFKVLAQACGLQEGLASSDSVGS